MRSITGTLSVFAIAYYRRVEVVLTQDHSDSRMMDDQREPIKVADDDFNAQKGEERNLLEG